MILKITGTVKVVINTWRSVRVCNSQTLGDGGVNSLIFVFIGFLVCFLICYICLYILICYSYLLMFMQFYVHIVKFNSLLYDMYVCLHSLIPMLTSLTVCCICFSKVS